MGLEVPAGRTDGAFVSLYHVMQELKGMLEADQAPADKQALLHAVSSSARVVRGADAPFLAHVVMTNCLGDVDASVRATAAEGLEGKWHNVPEMTFIAS